MYGQIYYNLQYILFFDTWSVRAYETLYVRVANTLNTNSIIIISRYFNRSVLLLLFGTGYECYRVL